MHGIKQKLVHIASKLQHSLRTITTPGAIILGSLIIASSIVAYGFIVRTTIESPTNYFTGKPLEGDFIEGNKDSKVFVVEYSDPECPFCVQLHPTLKELRMRYASEIGFVYRHFPLTVPHPNAFNESKAIECAGTLGGTKMFYAYVDALYGYKITNRTTQLQVGGKELIARNLGLNEQAFKECLASKETENTVGQALNDGVGAGVEGTPSTFILVKTRKGYETIAMIDGARDIEYFIAAIEEALRR